ncbi:MAG: PH domain-containing protein [Lachnospiraceae bacterium]|nr:PH domain-containing protein [Lachnospiraceae bacterium]
MKLAQSKKEQWEKTLRELELISADDVIEEHTQGDLWTFMSQTRGNYFFTKEKFIFVSGFGVETFSVAYGDISGLKTCNVGGLIPIIPTGVKVSFMDSNGKLVTKKCSVTKRKEWIAYLVERGAKEG